MKKRSIVLFGIFVLLCFAVVALFFSQTRSAEPRPVHFDESKPFDYSGCDVAIEPKDINHITRAFWKNDVLVVQAVVAVNCGGYSFEGYSVVEGNEVKLFVKYQLDQFASCDCDHGLQFVVPNVPKEEITITLTYEGGTTIDTKIIRPEPDEK